MGLLGYLGLAFNNLTGRIPASFGNLTTLFFLQYAGALCIIVLRRE